MLQAPSTPKLLTTTPGPLIPVPGQSLTEHHIPRYSDVAYALHRIRNGRDELADRNELINLMRNNGIHCDRVLEAFRRVPRHRFSPTPVRNGLAYQNSVIRLMQGLSVISQPLVAAWMLQEVNITQGETVLDIGSASGYTQALISILNLSDDKVYSVEYQDDLTSYARRNLSELGFRRVHLRTGDGFYGWDDPSTRFDVITGAVAFPGVPKALIAQLNDDGRISIPLDMGGMHPLFTATLRDGILTGKFLKTPLAFVPMQGNHHIENPFDDLHNERPREEEFVSAQAPDHRLPIHFNDFEEFVGFILYLNLMKKRVCRAIKSDPYSGLRNEYFGWVKDDNNYFMYSAGSNTLTIKSSDTGFLDELRALYEEWQSLGRPKLSDYSLSLEIDQDHQYEGWRIWDFDFNVVD